MALEIDYAQASQIAARKELSVEGILTDEVRIETRGDALFTDSLVDIVGTLASELDGDYPDEEEEPHTAPNVAELSGMLDSIHRDVHHLLSGLPNAETWNGCITVEWAHANVDTIANFARPLVTHARFITHETLVRQYITELINYAAFGYLRSRFRVLEKGFASTAAFLQDQMGEDWIPEEFRNNETMDFLFDDPDEPKDD